MAIYLYDKEQNQRLFEISVAQRDQLVDALEEESASDRDYYIDANVLDFLDGKVDADVLAKLREALGVPAPPTGIDVAPEDEPLPEVEGTVEVEGIDIEWREE